MTINELPLETIKPPAVSRADELPRTEESRWKLPSGHAILRYPAQMTENDFKVLQRQIVLLEFAVTGKEPARPGA